MAASEAVTASATTRATGRGIRSWSRPEHPDRRDTVAVPISGDWLVVRQAVDEGLIGLAGRVGVPQEPYSRPEHADRVLAVAVPVADEGLVPRVGVGEGHVGDPGGERVAEVE